MVAIDNDTEDLGGRARAGGQCGCNGEFYAGGTFMPSTTRPKGVAAARRPAARRALVEPGRLDVVPAGQTALFARLQAFVRVADGPALDSARTPAPTLVAAFADDHPSMTHYFAGAPELHALIAAYNGGQRFLPASS
jgi:hypothetical protein